MSEVNEAIAIKENEAIEWTPREFELQIENETKLRKILLRYVESNMQAGYHYYEMQGKNSLSKAGALNLCSLFKVKAEPREYDIIPDGDHISVFYRIDLVSLKTGRVVATGDALRNSRESKFRRQNMSDMHNTVLKMAFKSALIAAACQLPIVSELFAQDIEDLPKEATAPEPPKVSQATKAVSQPLPMEEKKSPGAFISKEQIEKLQDALTKCVTIGSFLDKKEAWDNFKSFSGVDSFQKVTIEKFDEILSWLKERYKKVPANQIQKGEILSLLEKLIAKGVYKSPAEASQDFESNFGHESELTYILARKAIATLTAQVAGI